MITVITTDVECPGCGAKLCNLCAGNGQCEDCGKRLTAAIRTAIRDALPEVFGVTA